MKTKQNVIIGVTSGIAAYKSLKLITLLKSEHIEVFVVMTKNAAKMVPTIDFEKASGNKVHLELFEENFDYRNILKLRKVDHIDLADKAGVVVITPATANVIAKLAYGLADDFLTTTILAVTAPVIICPSMNVNMWNNPIVQENINRLKQRGYQIIDPEDGMLACGYKGVGRLANIQSIKNEVLAQLNYTKSLKRKKIIVTAGGTMEKIDDVRYITNRSSGKMGIAIAEECYLRGANVLLLRAKNSVKPRYLMEEKIFASGQDLFTLVKRYVKDYQYFYHTAAVSDFITEKDIKGKLSSKHPIIIHLKPQMKILDEIKQINSKIRLIAFKAEYISDERKLIQVARDRLRESSADAIIANDVSRKDRGFEVDENEVYIILPDGTIKHLLLTSKKEIAKSIVDYINKNLYPIK